MEQSQQRGIKEKQERQTVASAVWGGLIVAAILLITTVWVAASAQSSTNEAVARVSEFYLDELAGRRALVVSEELKTNFDHMDRAMSMANIFFIV